MSRAHHKDDAENVEPPASEPADKAAPGKVVIDSRGHNVWQWAKDVIESTSVLLKRLDVKDLALEPTRKIPILGRAVEKGADTKAAKSSDPKAKSAKPADANDKTRHPAMQRRDPGRDGGFDPYNSR